MWQELKLEINIKIFNKYILVKTGIFYVCLLLGKILKRLAVQQVTIDQQRFENWPSINQSLFAGVQYWKKVLAVRTYQLKLLINNELFNEVCLLFMQNIAVSLISYRCRYKYTVKKLILDHLSVITYMFNTLFPINYVIKTTLNAKLFNTFPPYMK